MLIGCCIMSKSLVELVKINLRTKFTFRKMARPTAIAKDHNKKIYAVKQNITFS